MVASSSGNKFEEEKQFRCPISGIGTLNCRPPLSLPPALLPTPAAADRDVELGQEKRKPDTEQAVGKSSGKGGGEGGKSGLPFRPVSMAFRGIKYSVPFPKV